MNENDIFEMINTDGEKESFSYLATIELNNELYICAEPVDHSMVEFEDEERCKVLAEKIVETIISKGYRYE